MREVKLNYPFAGSHMREMMRSKVSFPPSFKAFVTDLAPCSLVAYSNKPATRWSNAILRCSRDPCSRTVRTDMNNHELQSSQYTKTIERTMLNTVRTPLTFSHLTEYIWPLIE